MKIGFNSSFSEISRVIQASAQPREQVNSSKTFGNLLADISPDQRKAKEIKELEDKKQSAAKVSSNDRGPMAQLRFSSPTLKLPDLTRLNTSIPSLSDVNSAVTDVKKPTVLEVKRVPAADELAAKSRPERKKIVQGLVQEKGAELGVDPALSMAVVAAESNFNPKAISSDGHNSRGLFQLLDRTGKEQLADSGLGSSYDPHDPALSAELGIRYLRKLHNIFSVETNLPGDLITTPAANSASLEKLAVAAYNAGEGRVAAAQRSASAAGRDPAYYDQIKDYLPESTQEYVTRVMTAKSEFESSFIG